MKVKKIRIPIYNDGFTVLIYNEAKELTEWMNGKEFNHDPEDFDGGVFALEGKLYVALHQYKEKETQYPTHGVIAHEAKHLVNKVFKWVGQDLSIDNDEAECYLLGFIVDKIHKALK